MPIKKVFAKILWVLLFPFALLLWPVLFVRNILMYYILRFFRRIEEKAVYAKSGPIAAAMFNAKTLVELRKYRRGE